MLRSSCGSLTVSDFFLSETFLSESMHSTSCIINGGALETSAVSAVLDFMLGFSCFLMFFLVRRKRRFCNVDQRILFALSGGYFKGKLVS